MIQVMDKVAIVTGGAVGIGRATADQLLEAGAKVVLADLQEPEDKEDLAQGERTAFYQLDVSDPVQMQSLVEFTAERFGGLDIMVNNAGIVEWAPVQETSDEVWHRVINVNLSSVFYGTREASKLMSGNGGGSIVNITSIAGVVAFGGVAAYCASKGGVVQMTRAAAADLAPDIRVNAVAPGVIETAMTADKLQDDGFRSMVESATMLQRVGDVHDIAASVVYLASDAAKYVTGQVLPVDGGWTAQ